MLKQLKHVALAFYITGLCIYALVADSFKSKKGRVNWMDV